MPEIERVNDILATKSSLDDFKVLKNDLVPKVDEFGLRLDKFSRDLRTFEAALARFDEIILTKGSKDDIKQLQTYMATLLKQDTFYLANSEISIRLGSSESRQKVIEENIENIKEDMDKYALSSQSQKTQTRDYANLLNGISDLKESVNLKADKSDIFSITGKMADKTDVENLKLNSDVLTRQFQQAVQLQSETLKTMLRTADTAIKKDKVRLELSRNTDILLTWINTRVPHIKLENPIHKEASKFSALLLARTTPSPEHKNERITPSPWRKSLSRKTRRLVVSSHSHRTSVDLP